MCVTAEAADGDDEAVAAGRADPLLMVGGRPSVLDPELVMATPLQAGQAEKKVLFRNSVE